MGCLVLLFALISPRVALIVTWFIVGVGFLADLSSHAGSRRPWRRNG